MQSIWNKSAGLPEREALRCAITADVAVIGGGMAGLLTATLLQRKGLQVVVLERSRIGCGVTQGTTAKITSQHGLIYTKLIAEQGRKKARQYADANQTAVQRFVELIAQQGIDCALESLPAYVYSTGGTEAIQEEIGAARELGIPAEFATGLELPFPTTGAICFPNQAQFHPLKFLAGLAQGLTIYENTPVLRVEEGVVHTPGGSVTAHSVVVATHYPFLNTKGYFFIKMHQERSYLLALESAPRLNGMYVDQAEQGYTLRSYENYLLFGGFSHRTGENSRGGMYERLRQAAREYFPGAREVCHWSAQDCVTPDSIPYIGRYSPTSQRLYVATGFQKWGMSGSMVAAMLLTDSISGGHSPWAEVFDPARLGLAGGAKKLLDEAGHAISNYSAQKLQLPKTVLDKLPAGHGGVVEHEGHKVGAYKTPEGEVYLVPTKCPHLGCQLSWNPDELSWDCPCHGSRFDYTGRLLDNPATGDISL